MRCCGEEIGNRKGICLEYARKLVGTFQISYRIRCVIVSNKASEQRTSDMTIIKCPKDVAVSQTYEVLHLLIYSAGSGQAACGLKSRDDNDQDRDATRLTKPSCSHRHSW
jgi:hypothetical protein